MIEFSAAPGSIGAAVVMAVFLATVVNRLVDGLVRPLWDRYELDTFWLKYIAWVFGAILAALTTLDLFFFIEWRYPIAGLILTALVTGGGANLIHDLFDDLDYIATSMGLLAMNNNENIKET